MRLVIVIKRSYSIPMEKSLNAPQPVVSDSGAAIAVRPAEQAEIELKLLAPQGALEQLREMPVIVQHARNRGAFRRLETVYYDTPERLLFQHGMSLRVRRSGKHWCRFSRREFAGTRGSSICPTLRLKSHSTRG
jgi:hypothetical protein